MASVGGFGRKEWMSPAGSPINVISFVGEGVFTPVLDSQVLVPLVQIGRRAPHLRRALLVLTSARHRHDPRLAPRLRAIRDAVPGVPVVSKLRPYLHFPFERRIWGRQLRQALKACGYVSDQAVVVHCRGEAPAAAAAWLRRRDPRLRILWDVRGAAADEIRATGLRGWYYRRAAAATFQQAVRGADAVNTVSHKLAEYLLETGGLDPRVPRTVIGCCADTSRFYFDPALRDTRRKELGLAGRFVLCYCGAMSHWQRPDAVAEAFAAVRADMPDAHLLVVSREAGPLLEHLKRVGVDAADVTVRGAAHDEVAGYLMAADVGLLLRENTLTNRVASPVKFAEYLRCGLPVILTHYIGDFSGFAAEHGVGQAVSFPIQPTEVVQAARALRERLAGEGDAYRESCSRLVGESFSWDVQADKLIDLYERLSC